MTPRVNDEIDAPELIVIDANGTSYGVVNRDQALYLAYEQGIDLIEISPNATPPVAKLIELGKYQYEQQKKIARQRSNQKGSEVKEVRLSLKIETHDLETKGRRAQEFLNDGDKVRVTVVLRGRENIFPEQANELIEKFAEITHARLENKPVKLGNRVSSIIVKSK